MTLSTLKRQQILDAATTEFLQNGLQACSMDKLADLAKVSKRTIYNHFNNKEELFLAAIQQSIEKMHPAENMSFNADTPIREQLLQIVKAEIELLQSKSSLSLIRMLLGELLHNPELSEIIKKHRPSCEAQFDSWLTDAIKLGFLNIEDRTLARDQLFGLIKSAAFWPSLIEHNQLTKNQKNAIAESSVSMFLKSYGN